VIKGVIFYKAVKIMENISEKNILKKDLKEQKEP